MKNEGESSGSCNKLVEQVHALGVERSLSNLHALAEATQHEQVQVRVMACRALGWLRDQRAQEHLLEAASDPDSAVRYAAVSSLALCGNSIARETLMTCLVGDSDTKVQTAAARVLGWLRFHEATQSLIDALQNSSCARLRAEAVCALGRLGCSDARPILFALGDSAAAVRAHALRALCLRNALNPCWWTLTRRCEPSRPGSWQKRPQRRHQMPPAGP